MDGTHPGSVVAGSIFDLYKSKLNEIQSLIAPTLLVVALVLGIAAYVTYRSWKKAVIAVIGGAIVIAIVAKISGLSDMVKSELQSAPDHGRAAVVLVDDTHDRA